MNLTQDSWDMESELQCCLGVFLFVNVCLQCMYLCYLLQAAYVFVQFCDSELQVILVTQHILQLVVQDLVLFLSV